MKLHFKKQPIALLSILAMLISAMYFAPAASAADITESENNDAIYSADITYDDYNNYGTINSTSDVDWWKITPTRSGVMNVWLGNIPSGCNYSLYLYDANARNLAQSTNDSNYNESMRIRVYASTSYYFKIQSTSGSSTSQYKLRFKIYDLKKGRVFTSDVTKVNSRPVANNVLPSLWQMGYSAEEYPNNTANSACNSIPTSDVFVFAGHGGPGYAYFPTVNYGNTYLFGYNTSLPDYSAAISSNTTSFSDVSLVIFGGCYTGLTDTYYQNLVTNTRNKGARCVLGWNETIYDEPLYAWLDYFFEECADGYSVEIAIYVANQLILSNYPNYYDCLRNINTVGNAYGIILG